MGRYGTLSVILCKYQQQCVRLMVVLKCWGFLPLLLIQLFCITILCHRVKLLLNAYQSVNLLSGTLMVLF